MENGSNTPDFILAEYLTKQLGVFDATVIARSKWYGTAKEMELATPITKPGIKYVVGDATEPIGNDNKVIVHVCNNIGAWGAGFVVALSKKWLKAERSYKKFIKDNRGPDILGEVDIVNVEPKIYVANIIGQHGIKPMLDTDGSSRPPIRYDAVRKGLAKVAKAIHEADNRGNPDFSVHMPKIGAGLAGGEWRVIEKIIQEELVDKHIPVTVYELPHEREFAPNPIDDDEQPDRINVELSDDNSIAFQSSSKEPGTSAAKVDLGDNQQILIQL